MCKPLAQASPSSDVSSQSPPLTSNSCSPSLRAAWRGCGEAVRAKPGLLLAGALGRPAGTKCAERSFPQIGTDTIATLLFFGINGTHGGIVADVKVGKSSLRGTVCHARFDSVRTEKVRTYNAAAEPRSISGDGRTVSAGLGANYPLRAGVSDATSDVRGFCIVDAWPGKKPAAPGGARHVSGGSGSGIWMEQWALIIGTS